MQFTFLILASIRWSCKVGQASRPTGRIHRVTLNECKSRFEWVGKAFMYYSGGEGHCQEVLDYVDGLTKDDNSDWQTCIAMSNNGKEMYNIFYSQ